jgi:hypothetical protein
VPFLHRDWGSGEEIDFVGHDGTPLGGFVSHDETAPMDVTYMQLGEID